MNNNNSTTMICVNNNDDLTHDDTAASISSSSCSSDAALCDILGLSGLGGIMTMVDGEEVADLEEEIHIENDLDAPLPPTAVRSDSSSNMSNTLPHRHPVLLPIRRPQARRIPLPNSKGVSRKYYNPEDCFAFEISNILTKNECSQLINVAATSSSSSSNSSSSNSSSTNSSTSSSSTNSSSHNKSFKYITHAMHTSPDGETKFEVKLERPNPHKLAVFHSKTIVEELLWKRLQPILLSSSSLDGDGEAVQQDDNNNNDDNNEDTDTTLSCLSNGMTQFIKRESISMPIGLNPRLRVLKYDAGDHDEFKPHFDATTEIGSNEGTSSSYITVLLYLNDGNGKDFNGGETEFLSKEDDEIYNTGRTAASTTLSSTKTSTTTTKECCKIIPKAGSVVLFEHDLYHRGCPLISFGTKYVLRTDILFETNNTNNNSNNTNTNKNNTSDTNTSEDDDNDDNVKSNNEVATVEDVLCQMIQMQQLQQQQQHSQQLTTTTATATTTVQIQMIVELRNTLSYGLGFGIDLNDTSIQCLCSPGRYVLQIMLHEHMTAINSSKNFNHNDSDNDNDTYVLHQVEKQKQQTKWTDQFLDISFNALKQQQ